VSGLSAFALGYVVGAAGVVFALWAGSKWKAYWS
jgi:hypothetical protein